MNLRSWLPALAYDRPVTVFMGFVALLVIGTVAWMRIPVQMMPSGFEPGFLWVSVPYPNSSPLETDEKIVRPVEAQLGTVPGIQQLRSFARDDNASFAIQFHSSVDMDDSYNAVVDRLERALVEMPDDVERYWIYRYDPAAQPVVWAGVQLPEEVEDPYHVMTRVVQPQIERIPGVASLDVWGVPQRGVWIDYDRERVYAAGLNLGDLQQRLASDNFQLSSGKILDRGLVRHARSLSRFELSDLARFPVKEGVTLGDIADIRYGAAYSTSINRINGQDAAALAVRKEASANTVEVTQRVREAFEALEADPRVGGANFFIFFAQGDLITDSIDTLASTALTGGFFAVVILFAFLREWRMTLLIAASIPFSLMITVGVLYFRGDTLNLLSLMGLMLAVGMVVDNAIVVVETIYRKRAEGMGVRDAAIAGTGEVNMAILASTATTMVVFLPVILMSESAQFSFFMGVLGLPVVFALGASLVVALIFAPLATRFIGHAQVRPDAAWLRWLGARYRRILRYTLTHRLDAAMVLLAVGMLTVTVAMPGVQCSAGVDDNLNDFTVRFQVPPQASPSERDTIVAAIEQAMEEHREEWGIRVYRVRLNGDSNHGRMHVYLENDAAMPRDEVMTQARAALPQLAGVKASIGWEGGDAGDGGNQIRLALHGEDMATLTRLAEEVARRTRAINGVMGAHLDEENEGADEVRVVIDRDAITRYGVTAMQVGQMVSYAMRGSALTPLRIDDKEIAVTTRFSLEDRDGLDAMMAYEVWSPEVGALIPLRVLADVVVGKAPGQIRREDRQTSVGVTLDLTDGTPTSQIFPAIDAALADMVFPRGYDWSKGRRFSQQQEDDAAMSLALLLSVCFVFLLMGVLFESYVLPLSIVTTIPMAMGGAVWALYLTDTPMDTMAGVGVVILVGVVVNNGIVLVDLVTQLRAAGVARTEALVEAGQRRLRPILMTALTTICGLVPMALGNSSFIGVPYAPLGRVVIGGLIAATVLTLLFVPFLYTLLDDLREGAMEGFAWVRRPRKAAAVAGMALLCLGLVPEARAQRTLTYSEVMQSAVDANPQLVRARHNVVRSRAGVLGARGVFDPDLSVNGSWRRSEQRGFFQGNPFESESRSWNLESAIGGTTATGTTYSFTGGVDRNFSRFVNDFGDVGVVERLQDVYTSNVGVSISQQLLRGSWSRYNMRNVTLQRQNLTVAELDVERIRQETLGRVAEAYWSWVYQVHLHEIAVDEVAVAEEALRVGQLRLQAGELAPVERTRLEAALVQAQANLLDAESTLEQASNTLLLEMGESPDQRIVPATDVGDVPSFTLDPSEAAHVALTQNLQLAVARANLETAELEVVNAKHGLLPSLQANASTGIGNQDTSASGAISGLTGEEAFPFVQFGGSLSVPLGNRAARGERDQAAAEVMSRKSELHELERSIQAQVEQQVLALRSAQRRMELADVNLRLSEETLAAEEALAEAGRAIQRDVLQARNEVARTRAEAIKARTDYRLAKVRLLELQGQVEVDVP